MDFSKERSVKFLRGAAQALHEENRRLRQDRSAEVAALEARLAELEAGVAKERAAREAAEEKAALERQAREAAEQKASRLEAELAALKELLEQRARALYGRSTERRPLTEPSGEKQAKQPRQKRKGHGPTPQPRQPGEEVKHGLTPEQLKCDVCGGQMGPVDTLAEQAELIALERRRVVLEKHLRTVYACQCGECMKTAPGPLKLIPGGRYALSFTVHVAYQKYFAHMPLERQVKMFAHDGLAVTAATLFDQLDALATALYPTYEAIWKALQSERVLRADETPWAVMSNGLTRNEQFYA